MGLSWVSHSTLIYTSELILCSTIYFWCCPVNWRHHGIYDDKPSTWIMVAIDFEKAFDSLSWNFLSNALNFGNSLLIESRFLTPTYQAVSQTMVSHHQCLKSKEVLYNEILCRLDFRRSLVSGLPSPRRTAGRVSSEACLWRKFIIKILAALLVVRNCHLMTIIGGPTWRLRLIIFVHVPFSPPPLLILAFQPILFHTIVTEGHYMLFSIKEFFLKK